VGSQAACARRRVGRHSCLARGGRAFGGRGVAGNARLLLNYLPLTSWSVSKIWCQFAFIGAKVRHWLSQYHWLHRSLLQPLQLRVVSIVVRVDMTSAQIRPGEAECFSWQRCLPMLGPVQWTVSEEQWTVDTTYNKAKQQICPVPAGASPDLQEPFGILSLCASLVAGGSGFI
jgi:hypothetical protein